MRANPLIIAMLFFCVIVLSASTASAQIFGTSQKPFSNIQKPSVVSPYMNMFTQSETPYQSLVLPQLRQQRINQNQRVRSH